MRTRLLAKLRPRSVYDVLAALSLFIALGGTAWAVAANSVGTRELKDGAVSTPKLKPGAVGNLRLGKGAVTPDKLAPAKPRLVAVGSFANCVDYTHYSEFCGDDYANWSNYVDPTYGFAPASFVKDATGFVHLQGLVKCTGLGESAGCQGDSGNTIFILPAGFRPGGRLLFNVVAHTGEFARVDVQASGEVRWVAGADPYNGDISLSGISFRATH
jgi:hypothetical protein